MSSKLKITPAVLASKIDSIFQEAEPLYTKTLTQKYFYEKSIKEDKELMKRMDDTESLENAFFGSQKENILAHIESCQHNLKSVKSAGDVQQKMLFQDVTGAVTEHRKDLTVEAVFAHSGFIVNHFIESVSNNINSALLTRSKKKKPAFS